MYPPPMEAKISKIFKEHKGPSLCFFRPYKACTPPPPHGKILGTALIWF